jgi:peptidoglycan/LPS O-acetylase OafA/YrhL
VKLPNRSRTAANARTRTGGRYLGFDVLRIVAALGVVLTHSFSVSGFEDRKPVIHIGTHVVGAGNIGVAIFFVISGFLVTESWGRAGGVRDFLGRRAARIWPALVVMVLLVTFVVGPIVTTLSAADYIHDPGVRSYVFRNVTLLNGVQHTLPGVFTSNPRRSANSSVWTLPYEVWCYIGIALVFAISGAWRRWVVPVLFACAFFVRRVLTNGNDPMVTAHHNGLSLKRGSELVAFFLAGSLLALWKPLGLRRPVLLLGVGLIALAAVLGEWGLVILGLPAAVIGLGTGGGSVARFVRRGGDPSYGVYILSYPLQQCLVAAGIVSTPWALFALSAPLALGLGYASWHFVERPALRKFRRSPAPA